jgi:hypothetical protein
MSSIDEIIELYKRNVDVTLLDECLKRTVEERIRALEESNASVRSSSRRRSEAVTRFGDLLGALASASVVLFS